MKNKSSESIMRKHGAKARAWTEVREDRNVECKDTGFCLVSAKRHPTTVAFSNQEKVYLWFTDRGRSRLINH